MQKSDEAPLLPDPAVHPLQDWQRRLSQVQRVAGMGLWDLDFRTQQILISEESTRICGLDPKQTSGSLERFLTVVHPADLPIVQASFAAALAGQREYDLDIRLIRPDGTVFWANSAAEVTRDEAGNAIGLVGTLLDITHRKEVEAVLRASEQRLRLLQAFNDAVHAISDPEQVVPIALRVLGEHMGLSRCAFGYVDSDGETCNVPHDYTKGCASVVGRYKLAAFGATARATLESGRPFVSRNIQLELSAEETTLFDAVNIRAVICCALIRDGVFRVLLSAQQTAPRDWSDADISLVQEFAERCWATIEQRVAEAKLKHSESMLRLASRAAHLGGWSIELPSYSVTWSDEVRAIHELPPGIRPDHENLIDSYTPEYRDLIRARLHACVSTGEPFDFEAQLITARGRPIWVRVMGQPDRDANAAIVRVSGALQDITARRQLEEQFRQSQKMDAIGRLAGGIAHDFNNLLSVVLSYSSLIANDLDPSTQIFEDITEISRAGECARELTRQLLAFSRQQVLQPRACDLNAILRDMDRMLRRLIGENISLTLMAATDLGSMLADPSQLEQVVMNLVVNARDATPTGGHLTIETRNVEIDQARAVREGVKPGRYVQLAVTDSGVGMSTATRTRVFEPFFSTKEKGKGTGLGLSTVHGIVSQSGGFATVESTLGHGSTFRIYLPRADSFAPVAAIQESQSPKRGLRGHETILVVEDEEQVRMVACSILRRHGYTVIDAQNGGEAFLICEQLATKIDLMLTDVIMPRMSGRELAERVVKLRPEIKIVYMSGYTEDALGDHGVLDAEIAFIHKPITPDPLLRKLRELLDEANSSSTQAPDAIVRRVSGTT